MTAAKQPIRLLIVIAVALSAFFVQTAFVQAQKKSKNPAPWVGKQLDGKPCKGFQNTSHPRDYLQRARYQTELDMTEEHHFDAGVENLTKGISTDPIGDIDFTLRMWPNHHRALKSAIDYRLNHPVWPKGSKGQPAECYLHRAINFSPGDGTVYYLMGFLAHQQKQYESALEAYRAAERLIPGDMLIKYNMGLTLVQLKQYKEAQETAKIVYASGFPLPGLRNKLAAAGHWQETPQTAETEEVESQINSKDALKTQATNKAAPGAEKPEFTEEQLAAIKNALQENSVSKTASSGETAP